MFLDGLEKMFWWLFVIVVVIAASAGGLIVWLAPTLWAWLKPILHGVSA